MLVDTLQYRLQEIIPVFTGDPVWKIGHYLKILQSVFNIFYGMATVGFLHKQVKNAIAYVIMLLCKAFISKNITFGNREFVKRYLQRSYLRPLR